MIAVLWAAVFLIASVIYRPGRAAAVAHDRGAPRAGPAGGLGAAGRGDDPARPGARCSWPSPCALRGDDRGRALLRQLDSLLVPRRGRCGSMPRATSRAASWPGEQRFGLYGGLVLMESASRVVFGVLLDRGRARRPQRGRGRDRGRAAAEPVRGALGAGPPRAPHRRARRRAGEAGGAGDDDWPTGSASPARCS